MSTASPCIASSSRPTITALSPCSGSVLGDTLRANHQGFLDAFDLANLIESQSMMGRDETSSDTNGFLLHRARLPV